jgi:hypothetical protein
VLDSFQWLGVDPRGGVGVVQFRVGRSIRRSGRDWNLRSRASHLLHRPAGDSSRPALRTDPRSAGNGCRAARFPQLSYQVRTTSFRSAAVLPSTGIRELVLHLPDRPQRSRSAAWIPRSHSSSLPPRGDGHLQAGVGDHRGVQERPVTRRREDCGPDDVTSHRDRLSARPNGGLARAELGLAFVEIFLKLAPFDVGNPGNQPVFLLRAHRAAAGEEILGVTDDVFLGHRE